ncbi:T-cell surface antigen CD2-like [Archocentrus centrarchus]|uniref:T-cell surface antigen CD2-like n=1 Tax=Archocentrus centrarchus TaxID=63155 RepID=UPI0011E9E336|nr:T-cell surface antigen CD2-like [Archocentrus centrarchus]
MTSAAAITVFLLCCFFIGSTDSQGGCDQYAATGTSVTVPLNYTLKESDTLKWRHNTTFIFKRRNKNMTRGKIDDVDATGSLKLTKLTRDKSGRYTPVVYNEGGESVGDLHSLRLCVLDRVQKPTVTMKCTDSNTSVSFICNVGQNENNFKIEWLMDNKKLEEKGKMLTRAAKDVLNASFSCNVSNPISSEISLPIQQNCYDPDCGLKLDIDMQSSPSLSDVVKGAVQNAHKFHLD